MVMCVVDLNIHWARLWLGTSRSRTPLQLSVSNVMKAMTGRHITFSAALPIHSGGRRLPGCDLTHDQSGK
jgi:hypothetical protein